MTLIDQLLEDGFDTVAKLRAERDALAAKCAALREELQHAADFIEGWGDELPSATAEILERIDAVLDSPSRAVARVEVTLGLAASLETLVENERVDLPPDAMAQLKDRIAAFRAAAAACKEAPEGQGRAGE